MHTELCKVNMCDNTTVTQDRRYKTIKIHSKPNWLSSDIQAHIETLPIPLIRLDTEEEKSSNIIEVKMR